MYKVQNIVLLYADSCKCVIFCPLQCVQSQIPVTFLLYFVCEIICMRTEDKSGGSFCIQLAYKCSHSNLFMHRFPLPSLAIPTTIPAILATIPNARNAIKCGHCTGMHSRWLSFTVIESPMHNQDNGELRFNALQAKKISCHF